MLYLKYGGGLEALQLDMQECSGIHSDSAVRINTSANMQARKHKMSFGVKLSGLFTQSVIKLMLQNVANACFNPQCECFQQIPLFAFKLEISWKANVLTCQRPLLPMNV